MNDIPEEVVEKFWQSIEKTNFCWNWIGAINKGLPTIRIKIPTWKDYSARRVSLIIAGKILQSKNRAKPNLCSNKLCVNPNHLVSGDEDRFWANVHKLNEENGCWVWTGELSNKGYGRHNIHTNNKIKHYGAHVFSWQLYIGRPVPKSMVICHKCDHPYCVNPKHLFIGTRSDNSQDMMQKDRGRSTLTAEIVKEIRQLANTMTYKNIAKIYNISSSGVSEIVNRKRWAHIL